MPSTPPTSSRASTVEEWCVAYVRSESLQRKLHPEPPPRAWAPAPSPRRIDKPGRPPELQIETKVRRSLRPVQLQQPERRAQLIHTFLHHELQAAELMAWAILAFPETPAAFRRGLLGILLDEVRHMQMYQARLHALGCKFGDYPVRDWFWQRVPQCETPLHFVALMGMGLEAGNLDHAQRFAVAFREAGDEESARCQEIVGEEEIPHVRFATKWFREWTGGVRFPDWAAALRPPLTPRMFQSTGEWNEEGRRQAGFSDEFLAALRDYE